MGAGVLFRLGRGEEDEAVLAGQDQKLAVEEVGLYRVLERQVGRGDFQEDRLEQAVGGSTDCVERRLFVLEGGLVEEQRRARADTDDVIVEGPAEDGRLALAGEDRAGRAVAAGEGFAGLQGLASREVGAGPVLEGVLAPDQQIDARLAVFAAEPDVIGRAFVRQLTDGGQGVVDGEPVRVGEESLEGARGLLGLDGAMQVRDEVGGREMHPAVGGVGAGRDGRGIGGPHGRGGRGGGGEGRGVLPGALDDLTVRTGEAEAAQPADVGALVGRQDELGHAEVSEPLHLGEALEHAAARVGRFTRVQGAGNVARRQAAIAVGRADEAVAIGFEGDHARRPLISLSMLRTASASKLATG